MMSVNSLVETLIDLYLMVVLLRIWLQLARADFYNPFSQFIVKATQPIVAPLRRIIPGYGGLDIATIIFAMAIMVTKVYLFEDYDIPKELILAPLNAISQLLFYTLILRAILSWVSQGRHPIEAVVIQLTEPLLRPIRRVIPPLGGLDLSMLFVIIGLQFLMSLLNEIINKIYF